MSASQTSLKILTDADVVSQLRALRAKQPVKYTAFYSSQLGGVVTDPALMVIPFDDHMVHRGHGIFDTAGIVNGRIYDLEAHLDRFLKSAERSKLKLPSSRAEMRDVIIRTTAASGLRDGSIRYWLSSGPGSLDLTPVANADPGFFVMIFPGLVYPDRWKTDGVRVMTTTYPIKPPLYAITKTTNYLPNVLMQMEAKEKGFDNGVFIDHDGHVGESSNMNVAFVSHDDVLVHPKFDHILSGCTSLRLLELAQRLVTSGPAEGRPGHRPDHEGRPGGEGDAAHRQLRQGRGHRAVGRAHDRQRQAGTDRVRAARVARRRHAIRRSPDRRALLVSRVEFQTRLFRLSYASINFAIASMYCCDGAAPAAIAVRCVLPGRITF